MSILVNRSTRVIVQGLTGREGTFHAKACAEYGTQIAGGVTPGKGGTVHEGWPIFNTVQEAVDKTAADASIIFVPPAYAADAIMEAADAELELIVCITEGIPTLDMVRVWEFLQNRRNDVIAIRDALDHGDFKTVEHVCVLGSEKAAWFEDTEGNILCLHEDLA